MANEFVARKGIISLGQISGSGDLYIAQSGIVGGNLTVGGTLTAQEFKAELISSSIIYESGSTKFGDSLDDIHQRTGSFFISGSSFNLTSSNFNFLGTYNQSGTANITNGELNVDNLRLDGNTISSTNSNGNIILAPDVNGDVYLDADTIRIGDANVDATLTTNGTGDLVLSTNSGTNSGTLRIADGINGNITLDPNGSGIVDVKDGLTVTGSLIASSSLSVGTTSTANRFTFDGGNFGSPTFVSGFAGGGFRLQSGSTDPVGGSGATSGWKLELDHLSVRGTMKIYELLINQIRATNGSLWVSSVGKVETVVPLGGSNYALIFDTGSASGSTGNIGHGFFPDDLIRAQRFIWGGTPGSGTGSRAEVYRSDLTVTTVSGSIITASLRAGATPPSGGFEFVRIGNTSNPNRRGAVYLTADDNDAPFIDVIDKVDSFAAFESTNKNKVRMGKLNGITSPTFGILSGSTPGEELYGFWASGSAYLEGGINAAFGKIANLTITGSSIYTGTGSYSNTNTPFFLSSSGQLSLKDRFVWDGNNLFISGAITASTGNIANFFIDTNNLWAGSTGVSDNNTRIILNSSEPKIALGVSASAITVANTHVGVVLSGSGEFKAYRNENNYVRLLSTGLVLRSDNIALTGSNIEITANGTSSKIRLGNITSANDTAATTSGSYIDNLGNALFQRNTNNFIQISGSQVALRSENFVLSGSTFRLNSAVGGTFALGITLPTSHTSGNGIFLSGSGQALIGSASGHRIQFDGSNLILSSSTFLLGNASNFVSGSGGNIRISGSTVSVETPTFLLGNVNNFVSGSGGNIRISGSNVSVLTPTFFLGDNNNFVSGSGGNIRISGSNVNVQTPSFFFGGATQFISGAGGNIQISSSNFHLLNGNLTASNGIFSGQITATTGSFTGNVNVGTDTYVVIGPNATAGNPAAGVAVATGSYVSSFPLVALTTSSGEYVIPASSSLQSQFTGSLISQSSGKRIIATGSVDVDITTVYSEIRNLDGRIVVSLYRDSTSVSSVQLPFSYTTSSLGKTISGDGNYELFHTILDNATYNFSIRSQVFIDDALAPTIGSPLPQNVSVGSINGSFLLNPPPNLAIRNSGIYVNYSDREQSLLDIALAGGSGGSTSIGGGGEGTVTSIIAGSGLSGGTIVDTGTIALDTGSNHFISGSRKTISVADTAGASGINLEYNQGTGQLSGSLVNSSITVGSTAINLGGTSTIIAGLTSLTSTNITGSTVSASGAITGGSLSIAGNSTLTNIFGTNITASAVSASGTITGNAFAGGSFSGTTITTTGNAKLGDATADAHTVTGSFGISGSLSLVGNTTLANVFTTNITASAVSASGTITGNAFAGGSFSGTTVTTTGNVKLGDATADAHTVTGSFGISGSLSVVGNSTLGNVFATNITASAVSASGTITGNAFAGGSFSGTTITTSGNAKLGDATSDAHTATGSFGISGSLSVVGTTTLDVLTTTGNTTLGNATSDLVNITGSVGVSGSFSILQSSYGAQISSSIGDGLVGVVVASVPTGSLHGVFFDYTVALSTTGRRVGTVMATWLPNGSSVQYTDFSTLDIGNTSGVSMDAAFASGTIRLTTTNNSGGTIEVRTITRGI